MPSVFEVVHVSVDRDRQLNGSVAVNQCLAYALILVTPTDSPSTAIIANAHSALIGSPSP